MQRNESYMNIRAGRSRSALEREQLLQFHLFLLRDDVTVYVIDAPPRLVEVPGGGGPAGEVGVGGGRGEGGGFVGENERGACQTADFDELGQSIESRLKALEQVQAL